MDDSQPRQSTFVAFRRYSVSTGTEDGGRDWK